MTTTPNTAAILAQKDTTFTKIFVGGLPYHTTDQSLREYFDKFGEIDEAVVITDRQTGKSRGYGFVTMATKLGAEAAIREPNPIIDGRKANVNLAYLGAKPRVNAGIASALTTFKAGIPATVIPNQYGFPTAQYVYPAHYLTTTGGVLTAYQHSPLSPTAAATTGAATQYIDYPSYASQFAAATAGFETYPSYATAAAASQFGVPTAYATYAQLPGQLTAASAGHFAAYQSQQLGERLQ